MLNVELSSQVTASSPLHADPRMWTDLMAVLEKFSAVAAESHRNQTELAIAQSLLATDETLQTMGESLGRLLKDIRVDEELYSNISRRLRADMRIDRERFGRLRDSTR